jgi:hypothetical protein
MNRHLTRALLVLAALFAVNTEVLAQCNWSGITESCGTVGIGTNSPAPGVSVDITAPTFGASAYALFDRTSPGADGGFLFRTQGSGATQWFVGKLGAQNNEGLHFAYGSSLTPMMSIDTAGNVTVAGNLAAKYQDVAEWVPSAADYEAGTVVVLDRERTNHVTISTNAFDTAVAGVISPRPGLLLGERGDGKSAVATTGRVRVKVDASKHPIHIGDLLVTSDRAGYAMLSEPVEIGGRRMHQPGTIIGKALEPLSRGEGEILVLLSLQ